jgi:hypothetical protein
MHPDDCAMGGTAGGKNRRKRNSRVPAGEDLVMGELLRRGFEAQLSDRKEHVLLVQAGDASPKPIQVKTVHSTPWYVRRASFVGSLADQVTVYVLLELERGTIKSTRFFVARNGDLEVQFRQPPTWKTLGFIDAKSLEKYEDNWGILR